MDSISEFKSYIQSWKYVTIDVIIIDVTGVRDSKGEKKILIIDAKGEFDPNIFAFDNNFKP
jgi:hypothetical protein